MISLRYLGRADNWWNSKIPPALAIAYASALLYDVPAPSIALSVALIVFVGIFAGAYGRIVNAVFDMDAHRNAGKRNRTASFPPLKNLVLCALAVAAGFAPAVFFRYSRLSLVLLALEYLLSTVYSAPPLRLKERGVAGILCHALGAHAVPCLYTISVLASVGRSARPGWIFPAVVTAWSLCLGARSIIIHQFSTSVTARVRLLINRICAAELFAFLWVFVMLLPVAPVLLAGGVLYFCVIWFRVSHNRDFYVYGGSDAAAIQCWQFSNAFYESYLPVILALHCALRYPSLAWLPALQIFVFRSGIGPRAGELRAFVSQLRVWLIWRGQLHRDGESAVHMERAQPRGARVLIERGAAKAWQIRLTRPYNIQGLLTYRLTFVARTQTAPAGAVRRVTAGVWQDHPPWAALGLCEEIDLTNDWTSVELSFVASDNEDRAYGGLWLGGEAGSVEVRSWSLVPEAKKLPSSKSVNGPLGATPVYASVNYWHLTGVHVFVEHLLRGLMARGRDARLLLTENCTDLVQLSNDLQPLPPDIPREELPVARTASWAAHWVTLIRFLSDRGPCIFLPNVDYRHSCVCPRLPSNVCVVGIIQSDDAVHYEHVQRLGRYWDAIVCVSKTCAEKVAALDPSLTSRIHVIPNAVRVPEKLPLRVSTGSGTSATLRVVYHGVMNTYQKRILDLAAILDECQRRGIPIAMTVAGEGPERVEFLRLCRPHIESGVLRYLGLLPHDKVEALLRESDVYLLPSAFEGMPHALLEAMAQGCVPVVSDMESAVPDLIRDGVNGYRVPVGDIGAFVNRLELLQADPDLRKRLAAEAHRKLLGSPYRVEAMVESYQRVFDGVVKAAQTGAFRRPAGAILPPPKEVAGVSIFPVDHRQATDSAERWLASGRKRAALRVGRVLSHFIAT